MALYYEGNRWLLCIGYLINYGVSHPNLREYAYSMVGRCGQMGIGFKECYDEEEFVHTLSWINKESVSESLARTDVISDKKKNTNALTWLSRAPGVGPKRAKILFNKYECLGNMFQALIVKDEELNNIKDIGPKTLEALEELLTWKVTKE